ncbi:hypothetical protein MHB40_14460 [Lysinibacillus sp. FSL K6-0057]|uniref:hypothetical protein n=1 Tax=Lysinibacillus sp. FSL K6-0057 TaxID=2921411 RepID=UPI00315AB949
MARKVKCGYCKKEGTNETFHKEIIKGKNRYFCNQTEFELFELNETKKQKEIVERNDLMNWIMDEIYNYEKGMVFPNTLKSRVFKLLEFYPCTVVKESFVINYEVLTWAIKNKNLSEFHMTCYIMSIVEKSINDIYLEFKRIQKQNDKVSEKSVDVQLFDEVSNSTVINHTNNKDISHFLEDDF